MSPIIQWLHSGRSLHLQHGPIDLLVEVTSTDAVAKRAAYQIAIDRFHSVLRELVTELPALQSRTDTDHCQFTGSIAKRMWHAASACELKVVGLLEPMVTTVCQPTRNQRGASQGFENGATTPMIAVAGSVADEVLGAILHNDATSGLLQKVSVNNGGDIALYLGHSERYTVGVVANPNEACINGSIAITDADGIGGVATSGWRGRSQSLGIADSVTVLAANAAFADASATLIANATDVRDTRRVGEQSPLSNAGVELCPFIERQPASEVDANSDLGAALVTTYVASLPQHLIDRALDSGRRVASELEQCKIISGACLFLQGSQRVVGSACEPINHQILDSSSVAASCSSSTALNARIHSNSTGELVDA